MKDIKCSSEAREKCPFDLRCVSEEEAYFEEGSACDAFNKKLNPPPPITNADHIRSMSDEELADFLVELADDGNLLIREWIKQPYKEN